MYRLIFVTILCVVFCGCSMQGYIGDSLSGFQTTLQESENCRLMDRGLPTFIIMLDALLQDDYDSIDLLRKAGQLHTSYALSFVEDEDPRSASLHYAQAKEYMLRIFAEEYEWDIRKNIGKSEQELLPHLQEFTTEESPDIFWLAMSWGLWINLRRDDPSALAQFPYVRILMEKVLELTPEYQNGLPHLFFGVYYGSGTKALGGDPEKGRYHFDEVLKISKGEFLLAKVLCAKTYCCSVQNRTLYETLLQEVISALPPQNKEFVLSNIMAKEQAKKLLGKIDEFFIPEAPIPEPQKEDSESEDDIW